MAVADTARLLSTLELQDKFSGTAKSALGALGGLEKGSGLVSRGFGLLGQAGNAVGGAFDHLKGRIGSLLTGPLGLLGLAGGVAGIGAFLKGSIDQAREFGGEVSKLSKVTGLNTEQTSRLAGAFTRFGIEADTAQTIAGMAEKNLFKLTQTTDSAAKQSNELAKAQRDLQLAELKLTETRAKRGHTDSQLLQAQNRVADAQAKLNLIIEEGGAVAGGATGFFKKYGLALVDNSGKIKDFNTLLLDSSDFFLNKQIPAAQKAAALAAVYGRNWQALIPILSAGRKGISDAEEEAAKLGLTLTKDNLAALGKLKEATRTWGLALGGLKLQLGLAVVPLLTDLTKGATAFLVTTDKFGKTGMQKVVGFFKGLIEFGKQAFGVIQTQVVPVVQKVIKAWNDLPAPLKSILVKGAAGNFAIKFLLGFSPVDVALTVAGAVGAKIAGLAAGAVAGAFGSFIGDFFGRTAANKLIPQVIVGTQAGVVPVFVTNPGFGGLPGPGGAGDKGGSWLRNILDVAKFVSIGIGAWWLSEEGRGFLTENNPVFDKGPLLGPDQSVLDLAFGIDDNTAAVKDNTAAILHPGLPPERVHPGGAPGRGTPHGVHPGGAPGGGRPTPPKPIPDTALSAIEATPIAINKLPPIIDKQAQRLQALNHRMGEVRAGIMDTNTKLGVIANKPPANLTVQIANTVKLSISDTLDKVTSAFIASGKVKAIGFG